jgi:predicted house-cleaning noncanonical NTP pyrophosphatase (MazG superfamily)
MNDELILHDSETLKHVNAVRENIWELIKHLDERAQVHDASKFEEPERSVFASNTPKLARTEYGTEAYKKLLEEVKPAIDHHYSKNTHHPEHWPNGIEDMDLLDLVEMLCDWAAATKRNKNGNIHKSIEHNQERFGISPQLSKIFTNTVNRYF